MKEIQITVLTALLISMITIGCKDTITKQKCDGLDQQACLNNPNCQWTEKVKEGKVVKSSCEKRTADNKISRKLDEKIMKMKEELKSRSQHP